jgi:hypothetical protein
MKGDFWQKEIINDDLLQLYLYRDWHFDVKQATF